MTEQINYKGYTIEIHPDEDPDSPRNWDNLGRMICFHPRYELGDKKEFYWEEDVDALIDWLRENKRKVLYLPLVLYDHSNLLMSTSHRGWPFNCPWDAGQVGIVYVTHETLRKEYNRQRISKKVRDLALRVLEQEVKTYSQYISGDVWYYVVNDPEGERVSACAGYYGDDFDDEDYGLEADARKTIDFEIKCRMEAHAKQLKGQIKAGTPLSYRTPAPVVGGETAIV